MYPGRQVNRRINPRQGANVLKIITFFFTLKVFQLGNKKELQEDDVFEIMPDYTSQKLGDKFQREWDKELKLKRHSLVRALLRMFGKEYFFLGFLSCIFKVANMMLKPFAVSKLVKYFVPGQTEMTREDAIFYGVLLCSSKFVFEFMRHTYVLYIDQISVKLRASFCALLYRKALKLNQLSAEDTSAGKIMTLIAKDVDVFELAVFFGHDIWVGLTEAMVMSYMVANYIGVPSTLTGIGFLLAILPLQTWIGIMTSKMRYKASELTDARLRRMQEIFSTIKLIKIYTWDKYFARQGHQARKNEMRKIRFIYYLKSTVTSIGFISCRFSFYICMITYMYLGYNITAEKAFGVIASYNSLKYVLGISVPMNIIRISEACAAVKRLTIFLLTSEIPLEMRSQLTQDDNKVTTKRKVTVSNATVETSDKKVILNNISIDVHSGLVGITGPVGGGKSTLLKLVLNDVVASKGTADVSGSVSYASQEPWIFPGTIRQNILFGEEYDPRRYKEILQLCALERDIQLWPHGDNFIVIDRGLNISKGQQARINLARAVYKKSDIYLLDDSLSALDAKVSKHVFESCIKKYLGDRLVILVTHNSTILQEANVVYYIKNGEIEHSGSYKELEAAGINFGDTVDGAASKQTTNSKEFEKTDDEERDDDEQKYTEESKMLVEEGSESNKIYNEHHRSGEVSFDIYKLYFRSAGGFTFIPLVLMIFVLGQGFTTYFDYFVSKWVDLEENRTAYINNNLTHLVEFEVVEQNYEYTKIMYTVIIMLATVFTASMSFSFNALSTRASVKIHELSFTRIMGASMAFFDMNLPGTVLNRFSKDMNLIDEMLPYTIFDCIKILFMIIGVGLTITSVKIWFLIPTVIFGLILYCVKCYYIKTGRGLHRLDGITRAPVVGHLGASVNGLTTIRATGNQDLLVHQFDKIQDVNTSCVYMSISTVRAFQFYMDIMCAVYITIIVTTFLILDNTSTLAGQVGLAITQAFSLTGMMQWGIRQWSQLENRMTSVERVMEYAEVEQEDLSGAKPEHWPNKGKLEYRDVTMSYASSDEPVLRNVSFVVEPEEKVGVIGRTGAGKSSILSALFRLYHIKGSVIIDGVDTSQVAVKYLRDNVSIIPQDPTLFLGTLRSNLDPYYRHTDDELWKTLKEVHLTDVINDVDCVVAENGANFSIGQRQLICLARAILRNNRILVLDEATANVDPHTDALIQEIIARLFKHCTILTIAHRLNTVMKCDKVMVVEAGTVAEFGKPDDLLKNTDGLFYTLAKTSGALESLTDKKIN